MIYKIVAMKLILYVRKDCPWKLLYELYETRGRVVCLGSVFICFIGFYSRGLEIICCKNNDLVASVIPCILPEKYGFNVGHLTFFATSHAL